MTTKELLGLTYEGNENKFQKALRKIKPFENIGIEKEIPFTKLEKLIGMYERKYAVMCHWLCPTFLPGEKDIWCANVANTETGEMFDNLYGSSLYEIFTKLAILYYSEVKNGIPLKSWDKWKSEKQKKYKQNKKG